MGKPDTFTTSTYALHPASLTKSTLSISTPSATYTARRRSALASLRNGPDVTILQQSLGGKTRETAVYKNSWSELPRRDAACVVAQRGCDKDKDVYGVEHRVLKGGWFFEFEGESYSWRLEKGEWVLLSSKGEFCGAFASRGKVFEVDEEAVSVERAIESLTVALFW